MRWRPIDFGRRISLTIAIKYFLPKYDGSSTRRLHTPFDFFIVRCTEQIAEEDGTKEEIYEICFFPQNGQRKRKIGNMKGAPGWPSFKTFLVSAYATLSLPAGKYFTVHPDSLSRGNWKKYSMYYTRAGRQASSNFFLSSCFSSDDSQFLSLMGPGDWITCNFNKRFIIDFFNLLVL